MAFDSWFIGNLRNKAKEMPYFLLSANISLLINIKFQEFSYHA